MNTEYKFSPNIKIYRYYPNNMDSPKRINNIVFNDHKVFCIYEYDHYLIGHVDGSIYKIITPRVPKFEAIFPDFPYNKYDYKHKQIMDEIKSTNDRIDKLVSHFEAFMIALGQRKASEDNLEI